MEDSKQEQRRRPPQFHPGEENPKLKSISGSNYTDFSNVLANQALNGSPLPEDDTEDARQIRAAAGAMYGIEPRDEIEGMLAAQVISAHNAAMECLRRGMRGSRYLGQYQAHINLANKLMRTVPVLLDALDRHRSRSGQHNRKERTSAKTARPEAEPPKLLEYRPEQPMRSADPEREPVPVAAGNGTQPV